MPDNEVVFCMVNGQGGPVSIVLAANNGLAAGGQFQLFDANDNPRGAPLRLSTDGSGSGNQPLNSSAADLDQNVLSWEVDVCSLIGGVDAGAVEVTLVQDGLRCPTTKNLHWDLAQLPQCSAGDIVPIRRGVVMRTR